MLIFAPAFIFSTFAFAHIDTNLEAIEVFDHSDAQGLVDFVPSVSTLRGRELNKKRHTSIGDTLQSEAGVTTTNFGPSSGRPVIRGLDGDRVRVLQNSLGTLDASTQSVDHAIPVDPLTIEQIEIVRGPMSLLYGSSAVGGVVNLVTNRIHPTFEEGFFSQALVQGETVSEGISSALHLNYGKNKWMFHADGSTRNLQDQKIPAHARGGESKKKGKLPNSFNKQDNVAVGASKILDRGYYGLSFNHFNTNYGAVAEEHVTIDMTQNRFELHSEYRPEGGPFRKFKLRSAQSDYFHKEIEERVTGTTFRNKGNETRLEGSTKSGNLNGVIGLQTQIFTFEAEGDEAFLPTNKNNRFAVFNFHELELAEKNALSFGARIESSDTKKETSDNFGESDRHNFTGISGSLGHQYMFNKENSLSTSLSYTERAPNFQELYSLGDHVASRTYEEGNVHLKKEKAQALEVNYKSQTDKHALTVSAYAQRFHDYISLMPTGVTTNSDEGFGEFRYEQVDAIFYGMDLDGKRELFAVDAGVFSAITKADWVRAKDLDSGHNLPRISPPRVTLGLEYAKDKWSTDIEAQYVAHQTKIAPIESRTDSYTLTNLGYAYSIVGEKSALNLFARVRNVFDVTARNHVSFLKDIAPMPGRNFILGAQLQY